MHSMSQRSKSTTSAERRETDGFTQLMMGGGGRVTHGSRTARAPPRENYGAKHEAEKRKSGTKKGRASGPNGANKYDG